MIISASISKASRTPLFSVATVGTTGTSSGSFMRCAISSGGIAPGRSLLFARITYGIRGPTRSSICRALASSSGWLASTTSRTPLTSRAKILKMNSNRSWPGVPKISASIPVMLTFHDEVGQRPDLIEFALHQGPVDEQEAADGPGGSGGLDQFAPEPQDVLLGEPVHEELHGVHDDAAGALGRHRGDDRFTDVREVVDVVDVIFLVAWQEELGRRRVDEDELRGVDGPEPFQFAPGKLRGAEEVHVQAGLPGLRALNREILAEEALLCRFLAEQQEGRGTRESPLETLVEDRDSRLRAGGDRLRRRLHHRATTASGSGTNGCQDASTW